MQFCQSCGIARRPDRHPDGFAPITNRAPSEFAAALAHREILDARYDEFLFPAAVLAGTSAAARAEPQNQQRVLLRYQRRVSYRCTFQA